MRNTPREKDSLEDMYPDVESREDDIQNTLGTVEEYGVRKTPTALVYASVGQTAEYSAIVDRTDLKSGRR